MTRTRTTPTTRLAPKYGTSSGMNPEEDFEEPGLGDVLGLETEIPRGSARPTGGLLPKKAVPRSPLGIEAGQSAGGGLNITGSIPLGGPISGRGGVNIGKDGSIKGGQIGLGLGIGPIGASIDVGTDQDEEGRGGCYRYVTVSIGPFSHTYGKNVCEPKPPRPPNPSPINPGSSEPGGSNPGGDDFNPSPVDIPDIGDGYVFVHNKASDSGYGGVGHIKRTIITPLKDRLQGSVRRCPVEMTTESVTTAPVYNVNHKYTVKKGEELQLFTHILYKNGSVNNRNELGRINAAGLWWESGNPLFFYGSFLEIKKNLARQDETNTEQFKTTFIPFQCVPYYGDVPIVSPASPIPSSPIRKKIKMDECCRITQLLQLETLRLLGREVNSQGLVQQTTKKGFIGEEFERIETPIEDPNKPKEIKVRFLTVYDMLVYCFKQANDLDVALDPKSYKVPTGKVQNPAYSRDTEESLKSNKQPDKDKAGNKRELEINKDDEVKMGGFLQQQAYAFQMLRHLEYLFPPGELSDALVAKSLLIPGAEGDIKIHNMIMAFEIIMQYLDATLGNPREILTVKDANPAIKGDQPIEVRALSVSDLLRQNIKFHIDTGGDVDALVNLELRDFRTGMANRQDIVKIAEMVQALFEDSGMLEKQDYIEVYLEGDPYAGQWIKGQGFKPNPDLEKKTEEATEKVLRETMNPTNHKVKVSRRNKDEKTDMRDLLRGLADFFQRLLSVPTSGDAAKSIEKLIESAKFKVQTEAALLRQNVIQAASASRSQTRKRKK